MLAGNSPNFIRGRMALWDPLGAGLLDVVGHLWRLGIVPNQVRGLPVASAHFLLLGLNGI